VAASNPVGLAFVFSNWVLLGCSLLSLPGPFPFPVGPPLPMSGFYNPHTNVPFLFPLRLRFHLFLSQPGCLLAPPHFTGVFSASPPLTTPPPYPRRFLVPEWTSPVIGNPLCPNRLRRAFSSPPPIVVFPSGWRWVFAFPWFNGYFSFLALQTSAPLIR